MKSKTIKEIFAFLITALLLVVFVMTASSVLMPKRANYGATWPYFAKEADNSLDVMFFGSSMTYCDVIPAKIWESSGLSAYDMAGPEQTIPISYYYLRESTLNQKPKMIFLELTGMFFEEYQKFTKVNIGYMPWGKNRLDASRDAAEKAELPGLFFPPYNYHSRWDELEGADLKLGLNGFPADDLAGYTVLITAEAQGEACPREEVAHKENYNKNLEYLQKIADYCKARDIKPVFYIAPSSKRLSETNLAQLKRDVSKIKGVDFFDFNEKIEELGLDSSLDYYDNLHLNFRGAEKFSSYLGKLLKDEYGLKPATGTDSGLWRERLDFYNKLIADLLKTL
ncbi:MAG: hypothetical protein RSF77_03440 [Oscillospiraceae bacterium]